MTFAKIKSFAKINLALNVIGKKKTQHKVESIVAFITLHDEILIRSIKSKNHSISFTGKFSKNIEVKNTVSNLLDLLEKKKLLKNKKFQIKINKKIPNKAGLGGGSMNAACILKYFVKKKIVKIKKKQIIQISKSIGSDVILGLNPANSIMNSKNKIKVFTNYKKIYTLIVKPNFGCSTKDIYAKVIKFDQSKFDKPTKKMFNFDNLKKFSNSLEPIAFSKYPKLRIIKLHLEALSKPIFVRMTGSGSAIVAYYQSKKRCDNAKKQFNKKFRNYWCIASKTI